MKAILLVAFIILSSSVAATPHQRKHTGASPTVRAVHTIPASGTLSETDLVEIARLKADISADQFSDDPTVHYVGRDFAITVPPSWLVTQYDRETHVLNISLTTHTGPSRDLLDSLDLASDVRKDLYSGQNSFGAKTPVVRERGNIYGLLMPGPAYSRPNITYTTVMDGEAARALNTAIRLRLYGEVCRDASSNSAVVRGLSASVATVDNPIDRLVDKFLICVVLSRAEWLDSRSEAVLSSEIVTPASALPRAGNSGGGILNATSGRLWLQIASGSSAALLATQYERLKSKNPDLFAGITGYIAESATGGRLIIGPFRGASDAMVFAQDLRAVGIYAFTWTDSASDRVVPVETR